MTDLPSLSQLFEEQVERVLERLRRRASMGFDAELGELLRFHRFLLAAGTSQDAAFAGVNLVEVSGTAWFTPHDEWTSQYRRIFDAAVELIDVDEQFLASVAQVIPSLLSGDDGVALTHGIVEDVLRLGPMLMHSVEEWVARRVRYEAETGAAMPARLPLGGTERRALARALPPIVGAWESVVSGSGLEALGRVTVDPAVRWDALRAAWPRMRGHLSRTAYCLAVAVWHGDEEGAALFRAALARWPVGVLQQLSGIAEARFPRLLMPDLLDVSWDEALRRFEPLALPSMPPPDPDALFAKLIQGAKRDMVLLTAQLLTFWTASGRSVSDLGPRTARKLLDRDGPDQKGGAPPPQRGLARMAYDLLRIHAAGERHRNGSYGFVLDEALRRMEMATEGPRVPGRTYLPETLHDRGGLAQIEAAMLATCPIGAGDLSAGLSELAHAAEILPGGDRLLRDVVRRMDGWLASLDRPSADVRRAADLIGGWRPDDAVASASRLREGRQAIEKVRSARLQATPIDHTRIEALRDSAEAALRAGGFDLVLFHADVAAVAGAAGTGPALAFGMPGFAKGNLTQPALADPVNGLDDVVNGLASTAVADRVYGEFLSRPRTRGPSTNWLSDPGFWRTVAGLAPSVGPLPSLVVDHRDLKLIPFTAFLPDGALAAFNQTFDQDARRRFGGYRSTIDTVNVFAARLEPGIALMFSGGALKGVSFQPTVDERLVYVAFRQDAPHDEVGRLEYEVGMTVDWSEDPVIEFKCPPRHGPSPAAPADAPGRLAAWRGFATKLRRLAEAGRGA